MRMSTIDRRRLSLASLEAALVPHGCSTRPPLCSNSMQRLSSKAAAVSLGFHTRQPALSVVEQHGRQVKLACRNPDSLDSHGLTSALGNGSDERKGMRISRARSAASAPGTRADRAMSRVPLRCD
jgi:hypothetical protein